MGQTDRQLRLARIEEAKKQLRAAMVRLPFDVNTAGATRVDAWKSAVQKAHQLLARNPADESKYNEARRSIEQCAAATPAVLAIETYGTDAERARLAHGARA